MDNKICQIYHVARCGSTLLTSLLSDVANVYSEPSWSSSLILGLDPYKNIESVYGSVVKFPSMISCYQPDFPGPKVFLYRPLAQHLCKMKSVDPRWIKSRLRGIDYIYEKYNHPKIINWISETELQKITYLWICSVFCMLDYKDMMWIRTNDFLKNKKETLDKVCDYFNFPYVNDFSVSNIDVKRSGLNIKDSPIKKTNIDTSNIKYVIPSYGIIETELALYDPDIKIIVENVEKMFPELKEFLV